MRHTPAPDLRQSVLPFHHLRAHHADFFHIPVGCPLSLNRASDPRHFPLHPHLQRVLMRHPMVERDAPTRHVYATRGLPRVSHRLPRVCAAGTASGSGFNGNRARRVSAVRRTLAPFYLVAHLVGTPSFPVYSPSAATLSSPRWGNVSPGA